MKDDEIKEISMSYFSSLLNEVHVVNVYLGGFNSVDVIGDHKYFIELGCLKIKRHIEDQMVSQLRFGHA